MQNWNCSDSAESDVRNSFLSVVTIFVKFTIREMNGSDSDIIQLLHEDITIFAYQIDCPS